MKKSVFVMLAMSLLLAAKAYSQNQEQLIRCDETAFEKVAKGVNHEDYNNKQKYALEVFREYIKQKDIVLNFSEKEHTDAVNRVKELTAQVAELNTQKNNLDAELKKEKQNTANEKAAKENYKKQFDEAKKQLDSKLVQEAELRTKKERIELLEADATKSEHVIDSLNKLIIQITKQYSNKEKDYQNAISDKNNAESEITRLNIALSEKSQKVESLEEENQRLKEENNRFQKAFADTRDAINNIYSANATKSITDMNPDKLEEAISKYKSMKSLLDIDKSLSENLQNKVNEMTAWKALVVPMKEAKQYLKGKYDDKKRLAHIAAIKKVQIKDSKMSERDNMVDNLTNQAELKGTYDKIIRNLEDYGCLPNEENLKKAKGMLDRQLENVKSIYRKGVFDSYDRGIEKINDELTKSSPSTKVKTAAAFKTFIDELKDIF